jgi:hypothetical protein
MTRLPHRMSATSIAVLLAMAAAAAWTPGGAGAQESERPTADPADVQSQDAIIRAVYDVISGPAGEVRDWDRFLSLFASGARLIPVRVTEDGAAIASAITPEQYAERAAPSLEANGFFETEIHRVTEEYGHIAHLFSTYESRRLEEDPEPFSRGINSFQLMWDGDRWWVVTIFWDSERPGQPIPARYGG